MTWQADCQLNGQGLLVEADLLGAHVPNGASAGWQATAPAGITITGLDTMNDDSSDIGDGAGWWGEFYWDGGRSTQITDHLSVTGCCSASFSSQRVGWFFQCASTNGCSNFAAISVVQLSLTASETRAPGILAIGSNNLWYQPGWVRGVWPVSFSASDPSGVCATSLALGSQILAGPGGSPNHDVWHQCPDQTWYQELDTRGSEGSMGLGEGTMPLVLVATNAAAGSTGFGYTKTVYADNQPPTVSLSGPTDAPTTAGTQYVTATAAAGPSGVSGIGCWLDGGYFRWYSGSSAQIPVAGLGVHRLTCYGANNARDSSGNVATSAPESWTLSIRQPTVSAIAFSRLVDALRCHQVLERVPVPARWVVVRRHHKLVRVRQRARTKLARRTRCHARTATVRVSVWKTVLRNGKRVRIRRIKLVKVVVPPHVVNNTTRYVRHGHGTTVNGWLGTSTGTALGGQPVLVLTAPDNGQGRFRLAALVSTAANGSWTAKLRGGPSRLVEGLYPGGALSEPSASAQVHLVVPAEVKLISISPSRVAWGGEVRIVGQLDGGYLPTGGALVRLRIGIGSTFTTYGIQEHVTGNGRFTAAYRFGLGVPSVHQSYWFQIASLPMGNYPFAPADSRRVSVVVGGHP